MVSETRRRKRWSARVRSALARLGLCAVGLALACQQSALAAAAAPTAHGDTAPAQGSLRAVLGTANGADGFARAERPLAFEFPHDHGAHPAFRSEWWYVTAVLTASDGREIGVQFTLFRQGLTPRDRLDADVDGVAAWRTAQIFMGHAAVADVRQRQHLHEERLVRGHPALAGVAATPFEAHIENWRLASVDEDFWPLRLQAKARRFSFDLTLSATKPILRQGQDGLSFKGPDNASYYYSIPRMAAIGKVDLDGAVYDVAGNAWLDHEWSTSVLAPEYAGWDWWALRLDDGRDLMLFQMRRRDGTDDDYNAGALIDAAGQARILKADDFRLRVLDRWRGWPLAWRLTLRPGRANAAQTPATARDLTIRAAFADQVMDTSVRYWEGVVHVEDDDGQRIGDGYMELTGYADGQ